MLLHNLICVLHNVGNGAVQLIDLAKWRTAGVKTQSDAASLFESQGQSTRPACVNNAVISSSVEEKEEGCTGEAVRMPIDLYHIVGSPPCHSVRLLLKTLGVGVNLKSVDLLNGENKSPEFTKMNPQHTVPTLNDNGFYVAESRTILGYLVDQYGKDDSLYPKDIKERTRINQILYFDLGTLYQRFSDYYFPIIETGKCGEPGKLVKLEEAFQILDKYLEGQNWVTGKHLTIADFTVVSTVASIEVSKIGCTINGIPVTGSGGP
ncbi:Glutathione S-transferase D1 [Cryptotermes secundus]|uniref:Glutathione S-transferase D1 n=1 Tax=Cryptotermes secundus TaxID=105785 RepID=A0A2J7PGB1_9NEOP|nr:Glutathione S-transferase D1 [Cryptotermes secundus]